MNNDYIAKAQSKEQKGDLEGALIDYHKALEKDPKNNAIQIEIGNLYAMRGSFDRAIEYFRIAYAANPNDINLKEGLCFCLCEIGNQFYNNRNFYRAENNFLEAIKLNPLKSEYLFNLANTYYAQGKYKEALDNYNSSLELNYDSETLSCIGNSLRSVGKFSEAMKFYTTALKENRDLIHTEIELTHLKQNVCDWNNINKHFENIKSHINNIDSGSISPFTVLSMPEIGCEEQLKVSSSWAKKAAQNVQEVKKNKNKNSKINIGYLSSDFRLHPLYFLIIDVFKNHNKDDFKITLYYSGNNEDSTAHNDFKSLGYDFISIAELSNDEAAKLIASNNTDILVDLSGFTKNSRSILAAYKPAVKHINWLGFPSTMGYINSSSLYDHILVDHYLVPDTHKSYYAENVIYLPNCYQPNVENRAKLLPVTKKSLGFDEDTFIYASFGQSIKITEDQFNLWLIILKSTSKSILWLLESNISCMKNLTAYAEKKGIESSRICFAKKTEIEEHINRHQIIDLYLDTFPYNSHTSASDAVWAHCPVLTKSGDTFSSRVAGSILLEVGCSDLIVDSDEAYINEAIKYASDKKSLKLIKEKIVKGKEESTLFRPKVFTRNLEKIYFDILSDLT
jgi:predicted O-linked N-acetylglucosamine transferase (SPINDLY family)